MIDQVINGYKILEFKGRGSFGTVYKCNKNNYNYAIKIFSSEYVYEEYSRNPLHNRITQEIDALKRFENPNIVAIYDHGSYIDLEITYYYVVMEYLEGEDLKSLLRAS
jgi:serine/threonine protein kinase